MWSTGKHNPFVSAVFQLSSHAIDKRASSIDLFSVTRCFVLHSWTGSGDWVYCNSDEDRATATVHVLNISSWSAYSHGETQTVYVQECLLNWLSWTNPLNVPNVLQYSINNCWIWSCQPQWEANFPLVREEKRRQQAQKPISAPSKRQLTHIVCFRGSLWRGGRSEQQCLPEGPWAQPALALLIHSDFVKQTFNFTSICHSSPPSTHQLPFILFFLDNRDTSQPKLALLLSSTHL